MLDMAPRPTQYPITHVRHRLFRLFRRFLRDLRSFVVDSFAFHSPRARISVACSSGSQVSSSCPLLSSLQQTLSLRM